MVIFKCFAFSPALPISSLDSLPVVEGRSHGVVASCRAVGRPLPELSWDTELPGTSLSRTSEGGAVSIQYSLYPTRSMNGKQLDCLVSHPGLEKPRRISNNLVVECEYNAENKNEMQNVSTGVRLSGGNQRCWCEGFYLGKK